MKERKLGVWLIGALGSISTTVILGALALKRGLTGTTGIITSLDFFSRTDLVPLEALEFGGCDIRGGSLTQAVAQSAAESGCLAPGMVEKFSAELADIESNVFRGTCTNCGRAIRDLAAGPTDARISLRDEIAQVTEWLETFKARKGLDEVVVVNLASTEPPLAPHECHGSLDALERCLDDNIRDAVRASTIYAYAAIHAGCPYINFTPSAAALLPAVIDMARARGVPVMGNDGKTGETLVKSALAPMFTCRNLEVLSWEGFNLLGNMDGQVLANPENKEAKVRTKDQVLANILGYSPHSRVRIDYVPSLGDQKTAWDFIHFRGFLGARMSLQFVWQGYDSLLAAPLVLDLVRLAELAKRRGESGPMPHLACYFKAPLGVDEHRLYEQFQMLVEYAGHAGDSASPR